MSKIKYILCLLILSLNVNAAPSLYGKETPDITCKDINKLSSKELKMVTMGIMLGTTAEGVSVSAFSRFGLEKKEDQAYVKGVAYSAFTALSPNLVANEMKSKCSKKSNSNMQAIEVLMGLIQNALLSTNQ